ncbi:MAG TPA: DUF5666 domain-containing protein [Edaphobacter sp.]|jgi:hypothetical protein|nr:DUF5666 domain-containing protein [Edaphobacter sp.]
MRTRIALHAIFLTAALTLVDGVAFRPIYAAAQAPAAAGRQIGTVKAISADALTLAVDAGTQVSVSVPEGTRILQLAPGSTDLKSAQPATLSDVAIGDRVLVTGKAGDDGSFTAARVILMKSAAIAQKNESEKDDWQRRGSGGLVNAVSGSTITISAGTRKIQVETTPETKFRRYAADSVKFEDTKPGALDQIKVGDQLRVRGDKSSDGTSIKAEEIVSGSFKNLSGTIATLDASTGTLTLKDLTTKKMMTVSVTSNSDLRKLPTTLAARFAARAKGGAAGGPEGGHAGAPAPSGSPNAGGAARGQGDGAGGPGRSAGGDLSQMLSRLPTESLTDLKVGDAVMIVASDSSSGSDKVTAVTMLSGVEPILAAAPSGGAMTLSPWNMGGGGGAGGGEEGGGGGGGPQ